jgi:hypothetical protein
MAPVFFVVRPAERTHMAVQVRRTPDKGKSSLKGKGVMKRQDRANDLVELMPRIVSRENMLTAWQAVNAMEEPQASTG